MNKAVFLDRDGTINVDKDYLYKKDEFEYLPGAIEGLSFLQKLGYLLIVVTNQSGIARGFFTEKDYRNLEDWMKEDLKAKGVIITASYFCPHLPGAPIKEYDMICDCRKPKLGLYRKAIEDWKLDINECVAIGDKVRDLEICKAYGCKGYLLSETETEKDDHIKSFRDWFELTEFIKYGRCL